MPSGNALRARLGWLRWPLVLLLIAVWSPFALIGVLASVIGRGAESVANLCTDMIDGLSA